MHCPKCHKLIPERYSIHCDSCGWRPIGKPEAWRGQPAPKRAHRLPPNDRPASPAASDRSDHSSTYNEGVYCCFANCDNELQTAQLGNTSVYCCPEHHKEMTSAPEFIDDLSKLQARIHYFLKREIVPTKEEFNYISDPADCQLIYWWIMMKKLSRQAKSKTRQYYLL